MFSVSDINMFSELWFSLSCSDIVELSQSDCDLLCMFRNISLLLLIKCKTMLWYDDSVVVDTEFLCECYDC